MKRSKSIARASRAVLPHEPKLHDRTNNKRRRTLRNTRAARTRLFLPHGKNRLTSQSTRHRHHIHRRQQRDKSLRRPAARSIRNIRLHQNRQRNPKEGHITADHRSAEKAYREQKKADHLLHNPPSCRSKDKSSTSSHARRTSSGTSTLFNRPLWRG